MEPEGGAPQAKWLKHLQIFNFWREATQRWPSRRGRYRRERQERGGALAACVHLTGPRLGKPPQARTGEDGEGDIRITIRHIAEGRDKALDAR